MNMRLLDKISQYYSDKILVHGTTARGVDWNSGESQRLRFEKLLAIIPEQEQSFSLLDFGCGYGALLNLLNDYPQYEYTGFDISHDMLISAASLHRNSNVKWINTLNAEDRFDYTIASGIFNVKLDEGSENWEEYIVETLNQLAKLSVKGFAFNMLSTYSDLEYRQDKLYYASPEKYFAHAKQHFSKQVNLIHDYPLYEFSIIVRKDRD